MVPLLVVDISHRGLDLGDSDRERTVSILPIKCPPRQMIVNPL